MAAKNFDEAFEKTVSIGLYKNINDFKAVCHGEFRDWISHEIMSFQLAYAKNGASPAQQQLIESVLNKFFARLFP
jgi:hypothetical protein